MPRCFGVQPVPLVVALCWALVLGVAASGLHLTLAHRLAMLIGPPPVGWIGAVQLAKLVVVLALGAVLLGVVLLTLHAPQSRRERRLLLRFATVLGVGGALSLALDLAQMVGRFDGSAVEALVEHATLGLAGSLLLAHWLAPLQRPAGGGSASAGDAVGHGRIGLEPA